MIVEGFAPRPAASPFVQPVDPLELRLDRNTGRTTAHVTGSAGGGSASYPAPEAFAWAGLPGRLLLNRDGRRYQGLRGSEDVRRRRG